MPKQNRKRKHSNNEIAYEIDAPKAKFRPYDEGEDEHLSGILFGGSANFLKCLEEVEQEGVGTSHEIDSGVGDYDSTDSETDKRKPAWYDEDDDGIEVGQALDAQNRKLPYAKTGVNCRTNKYSNLLKNKFESIVGTPKWASLEKPKREDSDSEEDILTTCGFIAKTTKSNLPQSILEFKKVKDLNSETYNEGPYINSVEFHPTSSAALVAGNGGVVSLFAVDGKRNHKLHSIGFERFPIVCAKFINGGNGAVLGSRHNYVYTYDLMSAKESRVSLPHGLTQFKKFIVSPDSKYLACAGKWGEVHVLSSSSMERVALLKQDGEVNALTFSPQGNLMYGHSDNGEVTVWDMNMRRVKHKFVDEGCLQGTTLAISSSNQFLATGSAQGVVNLYGVEDVLQNKIPKPRKTILNLTTGISNLEFNCTSEMLALSSSDVPNSMKLFHVGSGTVFNNFPPFESKLGNVASLNFSPNSGFVAIGNRKSTVALYRLKHYKNY